VVVVVVLMVTVVVVFAEKEGELGGSGRKAPTDVPGGAEAHEKGARRNEDQTAGGLQ